MAFSRFLLVLFMFLGGCALQTTPKSADKISWSMPPEESMLYDYLLGELYGQQEDFEKAYEKLIQVALQSKDAKVAQRALQAAAATGDAQKVLKAAELWYQLAPQVPITQEAVIGAALDAKAFEIAKETLKNLLHQRHESRRDYILALPQILSSVPDPRQRYDIAKDVLADFQFMAESNYVLATLAYEAKILDEAIAMALQALDKKPDWPPAMLLYGNLLRERNPQQAVAFFKEKTRRFPQNQNLRLAFAQALLMAGDKSGARRELQSMAEANPRDGQIQLSVAMLAIEGKDYDLAKRFLQNALQDERTMNIAKIYLGEIAKEEKNWEEMERWLLSVKGPESFQAKTRLIGVLIDIGQTDRAKHLLDAATCTNKEECKMLFLLRSNLLRKEKKYQEAYRLLTNALQNAPNDQDLLYERAMVAEQMGDLESMEKDFRKIIALYPDAAIAYNALGYTFADHGIRLKEARELILKAYRLKPAEPAILDSLGWVYYRLGELKKAEPFLRKAYYLFPDGEIAAHLGEVLWQLGQQEEARKIWDKAISEHPDHEILRKTLERFTKP